ncbi:MAG: hypothetical protein GXC72_11865 [Chitinophagaceae bacterium]|nr:hypothetical protein [Chitinophagaceae bacterium]
MRPLILVLASLITHIAWSQRALPGFSVKELSRGKNQVSWINPYPSCIQLAVQRSTDSINFRTIFSAQSPQLPSSGFLDNKPPAGKVYYRIFYVLKGGQWFFTEIKTTQSGPAEQQDDVTERVNLKEEGVIEKNIPAKPVDKPGKEQKENNTLITLYQRGVFWEMLSPAAYKKFRDSIIYKTRDSLSRLRPDAVNWKPFIPKPKEYVSVFNNDSLLAKIELGDFKKFRDSVQNRTKDTLYSINTFRAELKRFIPKPVWKPSVYVYTNTQGYLIIALPDAMQAHYRIVFQEMDGSTLFELKKITETELIFDKTNFLHAGWYQFELYKDGVLKEKNKFFLPRD